MKTMRKVLQDAADLIEQHGLAAGNFADADGRICTMEAIYQAATGHDGSWRHEFHLSTHAITDQDSDTYLRTARLLHKKLGEPIAAWNDRVDSAVTVCARLREIAGRLA